MATRKPVEIDHVARPKRDAQQAAHDAETVRLVREWAERAIAVRVGLPTDYDVLITSWCKGCLAILNRKPAAKKGGKR